MTTDEILALKSKELSEFIKTIKIEDYPKYIDLFMRQEKKYFQNSAKSLAKKFDKFENEKKRIDNLYKFEEELKEKKGIKNILCIDEVGRGPLAGPVVVCGVMLRENPHILYVNDSKKLSEEKRNDIFKQVKEKNLLYKIKAIDNEEIDKINIFNATYKAMKELVEEFDEKIDYILVDGNQIIKGVNIDQQAVIKGDSKVLGIAIASIIAKVTRDNLMVKYDDIYPGYGFKNNKGYGTSEHIQGLKQLGITPIHRKSFLNKIMDE